MELTPVENDSKEIIKTENDTVLALFSKKGGLDPILEEVRNKVKEFKPDLTTKEGRKAISSIANKVVKTKTKLEEIGKELVSEWKEKSKLVDAERRRVREALDQIRDEVRAPLTEWESREELRVDSLIKRISEIEAFKDLTFELGSSDIKDKLEALLNIDVDSNNWDEFSMKAKEVKLISMRHIEAQLEKSLKVEEEKREFERLKKAEEERKQKEHDEKIAKEAEERARAEAERKAKEQREKDEQEAKKEKDRIELEKAEAERKQKESEERIKNMEREAEENKKREEKERKERDERAKAEKEEAVEKEKQRMRLEQAEKERKQKEEQEEAKRIEQERIKDKQHRDNVERMAVDSLMDILQVNITMAENIVKVISQNKISCVTINY